MQVIDNGQSVENPKLEPLEELDLKLESDACQV